MDQRGQRVYLGSYTIISFTQEETEQLKGFFNSFGLIDGFLGMATKRLQPMVFVWKCQACALKFFYSTTPLMFSVLGIGHEQPRNH